MRIKLIKIFGLLFIIVLLGWILTGSLLFNYLSINKPVSNADLLIVEGWLRDDELSEAAKIFQDENYKYIITTGVTSSPFYRIDMNGDMTINTKNKNILPGKHRFGIEAYGTIADQAYAQFEIRINSTVNSYTTVNTAKKYIIEFETTTPLDSITIRYINDYFNDRQDRNLFLGNYSIDDIEYNINDTNNYYKDIYNSDFKHILAPSYALTTKYSLLHFRIPEDKIITLSTTEFSQSRTAKTAINTILAIDSIFNGRPIKANIFSVNPHTRRTFLAYSKKCPDNIDLGIIASTCCFSKIIDSRVNNLKEFLGILFVKFSF